MKNYILAFIALFIGISLGCQAQNNYISEEVRENIKFRVDNHINTGIVVGIITSEGTTYYSYGVKSLKTNELIDENSVFEIGSNSKTFTGILLADMVVKGELNLDDPLQKLLPEGIIAPTRNGESIKLVHMANHTSSLPSLPNNLTPQRVNPLGDYSEEKLYAFIDGYELTRDIGSKYEYSNYALGLLGHVLAKKNQMSYEELMVEVIAKPLELEYTSTLLTPKMKENLAMGHSNGVEIESWDMALTLVGAGAIRSTAVDMLNYLAANMGVKKSNLYTAMQLSHKNSGSEDSTEIVGLAWHTRMRDELEIVLHSGLTGGYSTFIGFIKGGDKGVVVLSNSTASVYDIGMHLLHPASALKKPKIPIGTYLKTIIENEGIETATRTYRELKENQTDAYDFEEYQLNMLGYSYLREKEIEKAIAVFKINTEAFPNSANAFDSYGEALMKNNEKEKAITSYKKSVELNPGNTAGIEILKKLGVKTESLIQEVTVDEAILETYVGNYELAAGFAIAVSKDGKQMKIQVTGQDPYGIYPKSENVFYTKAFPAQITFNKNEDGQVESLTLSQGGRESTGKKSAN
ncbi:MAG: serine hydrolase [Bacteroidales bacterium]|nr:serine hydrolase [Bacteroidales bacterium]